MREIRSAIITGPTGAVGQALCRCLLSKGIGVFAVCRPDSPRSRTLPGSDGLRIVPCDITELGRLNEKISGERVDAFFHLAWAGNDGDNRNNTLLQTANIRYTLDACQAAMQTGCRIFIGAGSQAEYGRVKHPLRPDTPCFPENGYGMAKLCAGQMSRLECEKRGIDHIWARLLSVYGPFEQKSSMTISTILKLLRGEVPEVTAGEQMWDYLYADDAADALYHMAEAGKNGEVYTLGSGEARPLREYIELLRDAVDPTAKINFGAVPYGEKQIMHLEADITALRRDTGFSPQTCFPEGIRRTVEWVKEVSK